MKIINKQARLFPLIALVILAGGYLAWQLTGLRYTNHDDIFFNLASWIYNGNYFGFAKQVAGEQTRLQAYIGIPTLLWADHFYESGFLYDFFNIGSFGLFYISLIWFLAKLGGIRNALGIATITLILFPLHYYFSFPQGYPVIVSLILMFAFLSASLLASHLQKPALWKMIASTFLFIISLWGSEYNFVLHPLLIAIVFLALGKFKTLEFRRNAWPHGAGWLLSLLIYFSFSIFARGNGGDVAGRVSIGFDFFAWLKTFLILERNSFLPSALWNGIILSTAPAQGSPAIPVPVTYSSLFHATDDPLSIAVVFLLFFVIFAAILRSLRLSGTSFRCYALFFFCMAIFPTAILSASGLYQLIVMKGYLQGHLASFYAQIGISAVFFLFIAYLCNKSSDGLAKQLVIVTSAILLSGLATTTFIYNNMNRQVLMANAQKWKSMHELIVYLESSRAELKDIPIHAAAFWTNSGVSNIPTDALTDGENYWSKYAVSVFKSPQKFMQSNTDLATDGEVTATYFSIPSGSPVTVFSEKIAGRQQWRVSLISAYPTAGVVRFVRTENQIKKITNSQWVCNKLCVATWNEEIPFGKDGIVFSPDDRGPKSLLSQFIMSRTSRYAYPMLP